MSGIPLRASLLGPEIRFTTRNPKLHEYNPITHLNRSVDLTEMREGKKEREITREGEVGRKLGKERKFVRSVPRTIFSDPLTGRVVDVSQTPKRTTFRTNGVLTLGLAPLPTVSESLNFTPRVAKNRVRNELYDPITNRKVIFSPAHRYVQSLGSHERLQVGRPEEGTVRVAGQKKKAEVAYVSPYHLQ